MPFLHQLLREYPAGERAMSGGDLTKLHGGDFGHVVIGDFNAHGVTGSRYRPDPTHGVKQRVPSKIENRRLAPIDASFSSCRQSQIPPHDFGFSRVRCPSCRDAACLLQHDATQQLLTAWSSDFAARHSMRAIRAPARPLTCLMVVTTPLSRRHAFGSDVLLISPGLPATMRDD